MLTALQQVEDTIAAAECPRSRSNYAAGLQGGRPGRKITNNQYRAGTVDYTTLVVAQATALTARTSAVQTTLLRLQSTIT